MEPFWARRWHVRAPAASAPRRTGTCGPRGLPTAWLRQGVQRAPQRRAFGRHSPPHMPPSARMLHSESLGRPTAPRTSPPFQEEAPDLPGNMDPPLGAPDTHSHSEKGRGRQTAPLGQEPRRHSAVTTPARRPPSGPGVLAHRPWRAPARKTGTATPGRRRQNRRTTPRTAACCCWPTGAWTRSSCG